VLADAVTSIRSRHRHQRRSRSARGVSRVCELSREVSPATASSPRAA
jgi:hypothetical protein